MQSISARKAGLWAFCAMISKTLAFGMTAAELEMFGDAFEHAERRAVRSVLSG